MFLKLKNFESYLCKSRGIPSGEARVVNYLTQVKKNTSGALPAIFHTV
jgi:hypothetical protein